MKRRFRKRPGNPPRCRKAWPAEQRLAYHTRRDPLSGCRPDSAAIRIFYRGIELVGEVVVRPISQQQKKVRQAKDGGI
jgi:hypothetical protein